MATARLEDLGLTEDQARRLLVSLRRTLDALGVRSHRHLLEAKKPEPITDEEVERSRDRAAEAILRVLRQMGLTPPQEVEESLRQGQQQTIQLVEGFWDRIRGWVQGVWQRLTGQERAEAQQRAFADIEAAARERIDELVRQVVDETITPAEFAKGMEAVLRDEATAAWQAGNLLLGGDGDMSANDRAIIRQWLARQRGYLQRFAKQLKQGYSAAMTAVRARMYAAAMRELHERGRSAALGITLPQVPRDGKTKCKMNCKCDLKYEPVYDGEGNLVAVNVYWLLRPAEHCEDCLALAKAWNPLRVEVK